MMPFSDSEIYHAVEYNLPKTSEYVKSHGGGIKLLCVKDGTVYIELTGTCHGCSMSLMTTKMVVQKELRALIHPELEVVNVDGSEVTEVPSDCVKEAEKEETAPVEENSFMKKMKKMLFR